MIPRFVIGSLSQRGVIQTYQLTPDGLGGNSRAWVNTATVWMRVEPVSGDERIYGMQIQGKTTHKITLRYRALSLDQRIVHKNNIYNIRSILNDDSRDRKLIVMCEQGVAT